MEASGAEGGRAAMAPHPVSSSAFLALGKDGDPQHLMENEASGNPPLCSLEKTDLALPEDSQPLLDTEPLEEVLNEMSQEIINLFSKYATTISERAAVDASYIQELDGILKEAKDIENHLREKREALKQSFTAIANTLHR